MMLNLKKMIVNVKYILLFLYIMLVYMYGGQNKFTYIYKIPLFLLCILQLLDILKTKKIKFQVNILFFYLLAFFSLLSSLWAIDAVESINNGKTLFLLTTFLLILYNFLYSEENAMIKLLKITMYAGIIFSIYVFRFYGFKTFITMLSSGLRIGSEIDNMNRIGVETSITFIIALYFTIYYNKKYAFLLPIPLLAAIGTGSKKVVIVLAIGILYLVLSKKDKKFINDFLKKTIVILLGIFGLYLLLKFFSNTSIIMRLSSLKNYFSNSGRVDGSTITRDLYIKAGIKQFFKTPILGIGSANSGYITRSLTGYYTYLHNNYVEMLATTGIIGFIIFYYNYAQFIYYFFKQKIINKRNNSSINEFILILIVLLLVMDIAVVTYYSKINYIYFLIIILAMDKNNKNIIVDNKKENKNEK